MMTHGTTIRSRRGPGLGMLVLLLAGTPVPAETASAPASAPADVAATAPATRPASAPATAPGSRAAASRPAQRDDRQATTATAPTTAPVAATAPASAPAVTSAPAERFTLGSDDVVVFLGDELVEGGGARRSAGHVYPTLAESFVVARYPDVQARFINSGWAGDTVGRMLRRLERDALSYRPTVVVVGVGHHDPGFVQFSADRLQQFERDLRELVRRCREAGARVWLITPPAVEERRARKLRVRRRGRTAVVDLSAINYDATLARYAGSMRSLVADQGAGVSLVDWYLATREVGDRASGGGLEWLTRDGRIPELRSHALIATELLRAWEADPIRVEIAFDWQGSQATVATHLGSTRPVPVQATEDGQRIIALTDLPLPWPLPGGAAGSLEPDWEAAEMCRFMLSMKNPPRMGIVLSQEQADGRPGGRTTVAPVQLRSGFNLVTAEPLRSLEGVSDLYNLIGTKNSTHYAVWRRLEMTPPKSAELAEPHARLIEAWKSYVRGYERMIANYPRTFDARLVLAEVEESAMLPTSRPAE